MGDISTKATKKVSGPTWDTLRPKFDEIVESLLSVAPSVHADLVTIYIKFTLSAEPISRVYAVMWVKSSKRCVVGLALPEEDLPDALEPAPKGMVYKGLTGYFSVEPSDAVPASLTDWAERAYQFVVSQQEAKDV